jgi:adenylyl-sulfate kinase
MSNGFTIWFTGLSGSGKTTVAELLEQRLLSMGAKVEVLDGDIVRMYLSKGLGYSREDRDDNIRRIGFVAELLSRNGVIVIVAAISPYREARAEVRARCLIPDFVEVYFDCPLDVLIERDVKGLYKKALAGEIEHFTGISDPYEPPLHPDIRIRSDIGSPEQAASMIWAGLKGRGLIAMSASAVQAAMFGD